MSQETTNEEKGGFLNNLRDGAMWVVDNGLYNTQEPWNSTENLFNIGFLGASVVAGAFTAGGGTAAMLGGRIAVGAAAKGGLKMGAKEVAISAPAMAALSPALAYANDALDRVLSDNDSPEQEKQLNAEPEQAPKARPSLRDAFNQAVDQYDNYVPLKLAQAIAGISTLFKVASGEFSFDRETFTELKDIFMEVALGTQTAETPTLNKQDAIMRQQKQPEPSPTM